MMWWFDRHRRLRERLSAYSDGQLAAEDVGELEGHLVSCEACSSELEELRYMSAALRNLPQAPAPRSFALTEADAAGRARATAGAPGPVNAGLRIAAAGLAMALAVVVVVDVGGGRGSGGDEAEDASRAMELRAVTSSTAAGEGALPEEEEQAKQGSSAGVYPPATPGEAAGEGAAAGGPSATAVPEAGVRGAAATEPPAGGVNALEADAVTPAPGPEQVPEEELPQATGAPTGEAPPVAADLGTRSGDEQEGEGALDSAAAAEDSGDGPSALLVTEMVLGALLGAAVVGAAGLSYAERQRR